MQSTDPLKRADFERLIERRGRQIDGNIEHGTLIYWLQPTPAMRAAVDMNFARDYLVIDALLIILADMYVEHNVARAGVNVALPIMQLALPFGADRPDTAMMIAIGPDGRIGAACGTKPELDASGLFDAPFTTSWRMSIAPAVDLLRKRARKHGIALPKRFAPTEPPMRLRKIVATKTGWTYADKPPTPWRAPPVALMTART